MKKVREGYKITELGEIPNEWEVRKLEDICDILDSKRVPLNEKQRAAMRGDIPYYGANSIVDYVNEYLFDDKLILMAEDGGNFSEFRDKPIAFYVEGKCWVNNHAHVLKVKNSNSSKWVFYNLVHKDIRNIVQGGTRAKLNQKDLRGISIAFPKIDEQIKISSILSKIYEQIDNVDAIIKKNKELKKGLMQQLLTKGIGHTKFKKTEIGEIPEDWEVKKFFEFVEKVVDFRGRTPKKLGMDWGNGDIQALSANNVKMGKIDFSLECYLASLELYEKWMQGNELKKDDILMTMEAPLGNVALVPDERKYILSQRVIALKTKDNIINRFMKYLLMSDIIQNQLDMLSTGTTAKGINQKNLAKVMVLIPSIEEQEKIASILVEVDEKIEEYENKKQKLEELKKGLMQQLLTGNIRVIK